jgi:curved DNA-binding protein CbpA
MAIFIGIWAATYRMINKRRSVLTINLNSKGGTTRPLPGSYKLKKGTQATVEAIPNSGWEFDQWSGDASGKRNPITLTINSHIAITANFVQTEQSRRAESEQGKRERRAEQAERERKQSQREQAQQEKDRQNKHERERQEREREQQERQWSDNNMPDPYEILQVNRSDTKETVKDAWRKLVLTYHPDRAKDKDSTTQQLYAREFIKINNAWEQIKKDRGWT